MDVALQVLIFIGSLALLVKASDFFIDSAEKIGLSFGISPFIIGVTIIAFGTSLPELAASVASVLAGSSEIVVGNVVGSNITNILLVLGITTLVGHKIVLTDDLYNTDMAALIGSSFVLYFMLQDGNLSILEAIILIACLIAFLLKSVMDDRDDTIERTKVNSLQYVILILSGVAVAFSATWTISAVEKISLAMSIDKEIIALGAIALGTSLPEVIVCASAARKGKAAIAVGNVVGSNIFNTFAVMAIPRFFGTMEIPPNMLIFFIPFMIAMTVMFLMVTMNKKINRWEGVILLILYVYYCTELF